MAVGIPLLSIAFAFWSLVNTRRFRTVRLKNTMGWAWVASLVGIVSIGSYFLRDFNNVSQVQEKQTLTTLPEIIELDFERSNLKNSMLRVDTGEFEFSNENFICKNVETVFKPAAEETPHLLKIKHARGQNFDEAQTRASQIDYQISQSDDVLKIPTYFDIKSGDQWRVQKIILDFRLPIGQKIKLPKESRSQFSEIDFSICKQENDFYFLEMTKEGLKALPISS